MKTQQKYRDRVRENSTRTEIQTLTLLVLAMVFLEGCPAPADKKEGVSDPPTSTPPTPPAQPASPANTSPLTMTTPIVEKTPQDDKNGDAESKINLTQEDNILSSGGSGASLLHIVQVGTVNAAVLLVAAADESESVTNPISNIPKTYLPPPVVLPSNTVTAEENILNVTTNADVVDPNDGVLSLREAISIANASDTPMTIKLPSDFYGFTLGDLEIADNKNVTIEIGTSTLSSLGSQRVFEVGEGATLNLMGSNVGGIGDIINSTLTVDSGAAIFLHNDSTLLLHTVSIFANVTAASGGAIYAMDGSTIILENQSLIQNNLATIDGGGIFRDGTVTIQVDGSSLISGNLPNDIAPVVLDLTGNGIHLISPIDSPMTLGDLSGNDSPQRVGWITDGQGILMLDSYGNGKIMDLSQISFVSYVPGAKTDLQGLAAFDTNHDNFLDVKDNHFNQFGVVLADGRFESLSQLGIVSISLTSDQHQEMMNGNTIHGYSTYQTTTGDIYKVADVSLSVSSDAKKTLLHTQDILLDNHPLDFSKLPEMQSPSQPLNAEQGNILAANITSSAPVLEDNMQLTSSVMAPGNVQPAIEQLTVQEAAVAPS